MSSKSWRLVVTELGASTPTSEARVEAGNWMTALTLARKAIGESGGVPPGASCSVAPDGRVTIQDAVARKTYSLSPDEAASASRPSSAPPAKLRVPKPSEPPPAPQKAPRSTIAYDAAELTAKPAEGRPKRAAQTTVAYDASQSRASATAEEPAGRRKRKPQQTIAYDAAELGLAKSAPPKSEKRMPQTTVAYDAAELGLAKSAPPKSEKRTPQTTVAYDAAELELAKSAPPKSEKRTPQTTVAYDAAELGSAKSAPPKSEKRTPQTTVAYDAAELGSAKAGGESAPPPDPALSWDLLHSRDEEPSKDSPLLYRERTYVVLQQTNAALAEAMLRARFRELRDELAGRPKGKLVNMAVFDHHWKERPAKPPLVTLQWKDWRGEPVVATQARSAAAGASPSTPPLANEPTAPAAPAAALANEPTAPATPSVKSKTPFADEATGPATPIVTSVPAAAATAPPTAEAQPALAYERTAPATPAPGGGPASSAGTPPDALELDIVAPALPRSAPDDRLASAFEALQDLFFLTTPVEGLDFVVRLLEDLVPSEAVSACLYDINTDEFRFVVLTGPGAAERRGEAVPRPVGLFGAAAMTGGEALLVEVTGQDERYDPGIDGRVGIDPETMALAAVSHGGRLLGLLQLINRKDQAQFSRADANLLTYVAEKLGEFLHAARVRPD